MNKRVIPLLLVLAALILFGAAGAGAIPGVNSEYVSGETITIVITNSNESSVTATLEANTFDLNAKNVNYKRTYGATSTEKDSKYNHLLEIDTTDVPLGTYNLIIQSDTKIIATDIVKIVSKKTEGEMPEIQKEPVMKPVNEEPTTPVPTKSPGFGLIALLGILAVVFVIKRK